MKPRRSHYRYMFTSCQQDANKLAERGRGRIFQAVARLRGNLIFLQTFNVKRNCRLCSCNKKAPAKQSGWSKFIPTLLIVPTAML